VVSLTGHDWIQEALPPWNQQHIRQAHGFGAASRGPAKGKKAAQAAAASSNAATSGMSRHEGHWAVKVITPGAYEISLRRWPAEANHPISAALPAGTNVPGATKAFRAHPGVAIPVVRATLRIDGRDIATKTVSAGDAEVVFRTTLDAGSHRLAPVFIGAGGHEIGAYYTIVTARTGR
jgi:arylsulfatase B